MVEFIVIRLQRTRLARHLKFDKHTRTISSRRRRFVVFFSSTEVPNCACANVRTNVNTQSRAVGVHIFQVANIVRTSVLWKFSVKS